MFLWEKKRRNKNGIKIRREKRKTLLREVNTDLKFSILYRTPVNVCVSGISLRVCVCFFVKTNIYFCRFCCCFYFIFFLFISF